MLGEALRVDRRGRDDHLEIGAPRQQLLEVAEDEVDVEAAFVRLVDDERVVLTQIPIALHLRQQDAVGHDAHTGLLRRLVDEAHLIADRLTERRLEFFGEPLGDRTRRDASRLGVADGAGAPAPQFEAELRQLRRLARTRFARDDDDLVVADRLEDLVFRLDDRQVARVAQDVRRCFRCGVGDGLGGQGRFVPSG